MNKRHLSHNSEKWMWINSKVVQFWDAFMETWIIKVFVGMPDS